ncbi:MAG: NAD-dependent epimerase/dehydratase family protein [Elusimicrobia bacterium]|nr:NAD-dependent epimerase/dehydratase family protein [Elusimicrobiota bacterium]
MKILVTGGAGFIGSNIVDELVNRGHSVAIVDNLSSGKKKNINPRARFYKADITDAPAIDKIFKKERPEIIEHLAAQIDVRKSVADPGFDAKVNILGTLNILESGRKYGVKKVIFSSSGGTIYGDCGKKPPNESARGNPLSPYGIGKYAIEFYLNFYAELYGIKYTILRYANVYGPRQDPHGEAGVVAIFAQRMLGNDSILIFGNGSQTRDYVFVKDVVDANIRALTRGDNEIINIGTGKLTSVRDLARMMSRSTGYKKAPVLKPARPGELLRSFLDSRKAEKVLGWKPAVAIEKGLSVTLDYFKKP